MVELVEVTEGVLEPSDHLCIYVHMSYTIATSHMYVSKVTIAM